MSPDITNLLHAWRGGDPTALDQLMPLVYDELRRLARGQLRYERSGHSLQPTALVNEAYLRLAGIHGIDWRDRSHFLAMSARVMRRVLVDSARARLYLKRGGGATCVVFDETAFVVSDRGHSLVELDDALEALADLDPRKARVIELRFFAGLTIEETAAELHISVDTVVRDWQFARVWLLRELSARSEMPLTNSWARVEEIFHAARILPHEERERFLADVCGDAAEVAAEVRSLLQQTGGLNGFLERPAAHHVAPIASGTRLGGYEIKSFVGSGGMGDVYLASDVQLHRDVAIKVLPDLFSQDPARLLRFEREARLLAQVNHPAVAAIYGCEHAGDRHFLVLEYVPGDTLAEVISSGAVPLDRALSIAIQIASAVQAAHDRGIVHRDLKPANIKITPDGAIKVLDFGLARSTSQTHARVSDEASGPRDRTATGAILGTAAYMSPEQARGQVVDARTDIWAFGCILFELITGTRAFAGATASDTLVNVLTGTPDWDRVPAAAPSLVRNVLRRCLQKDPADRFHSIADARFLLEDTARPRPEPRWAGRRLARARGLWPAVAGAAVLIAGATVTASFWRGRAPVVVEGHRFVIPVTTGHLRGNEAMAISPDGTTFVFAVQEGNPLVSQLYRRAVNEFEATAIPGTRTGARPFFTRRPVGRLFQR